MSISNTYVDLAVEVLQKLGGAKRKRSDDPTSGLARISIPNLCNDESTPPPISNKSWKVFFFNGDSYEGDMQNDKLHGKGKRTCTNGSSYNGEWQNGKPHGQGKTTCTNGDNYEGQWQIGFPHGQGKMTDVNGDSYEGDMQNGKPHGKGKRTCTNGSSYNGEWQNGILQRKAL